MASAGEVFCLLAWTLYSDIHIASNMSHETESWNCICIGGLGGTQWRIVFRGFVAYCTLKYHQGSRPPAGADTTKKSRTPSSPGSVDPALRPRANCKSTLNIPSRPPSVLGASCSFQLVTNSAPPALTEANRDSWSRLRTIEGNIDAPTQSWTRFRQPVWPSAWHRLAYRCIPVVFKVRVAR